MTAKRSRTTKSQTDWRVGFRRALIDTLISEGAPVRSDGGNSFGWLDWSWETTVKAVNEAIAADLIDYDASSWVEVSWDEFKGTFYEGDTREVGIDLTLVLTDGRRFKYRYAGTPGALILSIVKDPA